MFFSSFEETNIAAGKMVTYNGSQHGYTRLLTDGSTVPEDGECFLVDPGGDQEFSLHLHLEQSAAVRTVIFHLKDGANFF